ncbi:MAG TPA: hypothetical protein VER33_16900, partial [Polyangiaceae bacterium]|nr:hypothetical protein [Polyangiaceae bacterium]
RGGAVVSIDPVSGMQLARQPVCKAPRGLAFESATGLLHVACAEGKLVSFNPDTKVVTRTLELGADLRDVMVRGSELWITRFKSAEVVRIQSEGSVLAPLRFPETAASLARVIKQPDGELLDFLPARARAEVAWRAVPIATGGAVVVHQHAIVDEVPLSEPSPSGSSAYGGGGFDQCGGVVKNALTVLDASGRVLTTQRFMGAPLPVDIAVSADGLRVVMAHAGTPDPAAPRPFAIFSDGGGTSGGSFAGPGPAFPGNSSVTLFNIKGSDVSPPHVSCRMTEAPIQVEGPVVAVAFAPGGTVVAQRREPPQLVVVGIRDTEMAIDLPGNGSFVDTAHEVFHRDAGGGIACASCHPEGGEDGHVWSFEGFGPRRTQALHVGLAETAPFHWDGSLRDVGALMSEVFVGRMGGVKQSGERLAALTDWLTAMPRPAAIRDVQDPAALRGRALFESPAVACSSCHSGSRFTNNRTVTVGTLAGALQVPSLVAIGHRAPFMHDGCAATLADRFNPACGGSQHGNVEQLSPAERGDLVAYLESL